jgi:signal transduction histidine kinase
LPVRRFGFARTTAFRLTLLHLALTLLGTALLGGVAWWTTVGFAARETQAEVSRGMGVLLQSAALSGARGVALSIEARLAADRAGVEYYSLVAPGGQALAGNVGNAPRAVGWQEFPVRQPDGSERPVLALVAPLPGGGTLLVGRDLSPVRALQARLLEAAAWVGAGALLLGLLGGVLIGRGVARRAALMEAALAEVQQGDLDRRLPVGASAEGGGDDEFDRLSARINAALDRLQALMTALRSVTDDIAHDLRTPLQRLRQRLDEAGRATSPEAWQAQAEAARAECDALLELFAGLLRIAEVEAGSARAGFARFDLSAVAATVAEVYQPEAEARGQALGTGIAPGVAMLGDAALVTQMLANLVANAVRHGREGGRVAIALHPTPAGGALLEVTDDGPGIPQAEREKVFRRFHRLDAARSTPGSGLGLALVRAVANLHGMDVTLEDAAPGLRVRVQVPPG